MGQKRDPRNRATHTGSPDEKGTTPVQEEGTGGEKLWSFQEIVLYQVHICMEKSF